MRNLKWINLVWFFISLVILFALSSFVFYPEGFGIWRAKFDKTYDKEIKIK